MTLNESWTMALPRNLPPKRNSCARCRSDTTLCCALIGYINTSQRKPPSANQSAASSARVSSAHRGLVV
ncbi:hypothetical protein QQF64_012834 [Cirrhinus molitorella]|uniref:Uncharacterized protein n=1 Tax=Cirrhinus molitorella TaxID=172907 RepID=A0ABR3LZS1_9TELE